MAVGSASAESPCRCKRCRGAGAARTPCLRASRSYYDVGVCVLGKRCGYAHGQDELRADPDIGNGTHALAHGWRRNGARRVGDSGS